MGYFLIHGSILASFNYYISITEATTVPVQAVHFSRIAGADNTISTIQYIEQFVFIHFAMFINS